MIKDIEIKKVDDVGIAIIPHDNKLGEKEWTAYIVNMKSETIESVFISTTGYGEVNGIKKKTSTLRYQIDKIPAKSLKNIELITEELFHLTNEFLVTFFIDGELFDRKYIFLPGSINEKHLTKIPLIKEKGILIL